MKPTLEPDNEAHQADGDAADPLRRRPPPETLNWAARSVGRGAKVLAVCPLTEGHSHANHLVTVRAASGDHQELVLRRWARPGWELHDPDETPEREAAVLELLGAVPVPTPRLINLDSDGSVCDVPALLTDRLPGGPPGPPGDRDSFVRQLAEVLPAIHAVCDVPGEIPPYRRYHENLDSIEPPWWARRPDLWRQGAELVAEDPPPARRECFIHRDYHPGNTLWSGGRLTGVVDWTQGSWGPPGVDTAHMRWNLAVGHGLRGSAVGRCA